MSMMQYVEKKSRTEKGFCIAWLLDGKSFAIFNKDEFLNTVYRKFFKASKFESFTRKRKYLLYRSVNNSVISS